MEENFGIDDCRDLMDKARADERRKVWIAAAEMAEQEAEGWRERRDLAAMADDNDGTLRAAAKAEMASLLAARFHAKAEGE